MTTVVVTGPPTITGSFQSAYDGTTYYGWTFPVVVDGQAGVYTVWLDTEDPDAEPFAEEGVIDDLEADPGAMGDIAENDGYGDFDGAFGDGQDGADDGGDGAVAGTGGGYGDSV
jgi:hypothetical protein